MPLYVSSLLKNKFPSIHDAFTKVLNDDLCPIENTRDIWCRDYMPIPVRNNQFVSFTFTPPYLSGRKYDPVRTTRDEAIANLENFKIVNSPLIIDGGNVVKYGCEAIMTEAIYSWNQERSRQEIREQLCHLLKLKKLTVVPPEPGDTFMHADGILQIVEPGVIVINSYNNQTTRTEREFTSKLTKKLHKAGYKTILLPYKPVNEVKNGIASAKGLYVNFVRYKKYLFAPIFNQKEDDVALKILDETFKTCTVIPIDCRKLAKYGGLLHCTTWGIEDLTV